MFELLKRGAEERNARTSERLRELAANGDHPWQQREFIARTSGRTWNADVDKAIMRMIKDSVTYKKIASELGNGLTRNDITNRWTRHLKESSGIIKPAVKRGFQSRITWTADDDKAIMRMKKDGVSYKNNCIRIGQWPT